MNVNLLEYVEFHSSVFTSSDKSELGIFWLDDAYSKVIHSKTVLEEDTDKNDPDKYAFQHYNEWANRPEGIPGDYKDYPRGRIFYQNHKYVVEVNFQTTPIVESYIRQYFNLPIETEFKTGYW